MSDTSYPPRPGTAPTTGLPPAAPGGTAAGDDSTAGGARERASQTASHAADAGRDVAHEAQERAGEVAHEAADRAKDLWSQAQGQASSQASHQQGRLADGLRHLGNELDEMSRTSPDPGYASGAAGRGSHAANQLADWFEQREPGDVLHEVEDFARRRPGAFIAIAAGAGLVAGRLLRGAKEAKDGATAGSSRTTGGVSDVDRP
ncbi:hypothetical protein UQW22_04030 [Isoptericola halotolerans]|uniref:hypothetical protein n=1 Tax=Isoptericola halotolerans TaxID=300560 RepID=UPI00388D9083